MDVREWLSENHAKLLSSNKFKFDTAGLCFKAEDETDVAGKTLASVSSFSHAETRYPLLILIKR